MPARAPLPTYQLLFRADQYPRVDAQRALQTENYRYRPRDRAVREHYKVQTAAAATAASRNR